MYTYTTKVLHHGSWGWRPVVERTHQAEQYGRLVTVKESRKGDYRPSEEKAQRSADTMARDWAARDGQQIEAKG